MSTNNNKQTEPEAVKTVSKDAKTHKQRAALYTENLPTFYVGTGNNAEL
jgi:hypothetical protein